MSNNAQPEIRFPGFTEGWEQHKLIEVARYRNGKAHEQAIDESGKYIVVNSKFVSTNGRVKKYTNIIIDPLKKNELAFVLSDVPNGKAIARTFLVDKEHRYSLNQRIAGITPHKDTDSYFLNVLMNRNPYFLKFDNGVGQTNLTKADVENFIGHYPSYEEQQKIGTFFKQLDDTIALHQRKLDLLKETKKGFLQKMFPKNGAKVPEIRFPGFTEAWEERKLGSIYDFSKGKGLPLNSFTYSKDDPAIAYGHLYTKYSEVISEVYLSSDDDGVLSKDNDLLFPGSSTVPNGTAQANAIMLNNVKLGGDIIIARPKQDTRVLSIFMSYQINSQRQKLFPITVGTTITHMYGKDLSKVKFFITNYSEQQKIGAFFKQLDDTIALHQRKLDLLKETKKGFLQKMFV
ncbi:restriction endonuclease subunit S [Enterococcus faecium]|uniref:restriction endonuclease subunit S n=1 Tax=Enterococcus TaxID=1350 RepID=UPI00100F7F68|nr:restriction endonuclease subunit S [Enterococcus faecium]EMF0479597.1 restriction endonuclease subunit S [Enterococcus faecium]RXW76095.1 restriction endonuclease subunit S [Enterococcus faecium]